MSFWCFVCFSSLFNLQGTSRSQSAELHYSTAAPVCQAFSFQILLSSAQALSRANSFILAHLLDFVNTFFKTFFDSHRCSFDFGSGQPASALLIYQNKTPLSTLFCNFFRLFFEVFSRPQHLVFALKFDHYFALTSR